MPAIRRNQLGRNKRLNKSLNPQSKLRNTPPNFGNKDANAGKDLEFDMEHFVTTNNVFNSTLDADAYSATKTNFKRKTPFT